MAHYDVTALIGEGGMREGYLARDTMLTRRVAVKILREAFSSDPACLAWPRGAPSRPASDRNADRCVRRS